MARLRAPRGSPLAALVVVTVAIFTDMLLYGLVVPILPGYAASMGVPEWAIGVLFGSYAFTLLLTTPLFGALADRVGRRGPMMWGLFGLMAATLLFAFATNYMTLLVARGLQGVAAAATWTAGLALLADAFPSQARGRIMGIALTGMTAGLLVGPPLGGLLYEWGGYQWPFLLAAGLAALDGVARGLLLADPPRRETETISPLELLRDRSILVTVGVVIAGAGMWGLLEPILPLYLEREYGFSPGGIGLLFGAATLTYGISAPVVGALCDRWGRRPTMVAGLVLVAAALPLLGLPSAVVASGALMLVSIGYGLALTPTLPALADAVDRRGGTAYGSAYALFNEAYGVGMMAGPVVGGVLAGAFGLPLTLVVTALAMLAYLPALLGSARSSRSSAASSGDVAKL